MKIYSCKPSILQDYSEEPFTLKNYSSKDYSEEAFTLKKYSSKPLIQNNLNNLKYTKMSNLPEKKYPPTSAIVNTSTNSGNVNLNVVLNRLNQPPSVSLDSYIEMIPPKKLDIKQTDSKKLNTIISFPHQFPGLSYPLVQNDKWIYSIMPSDSKIVKKIEHPEVLNLKLIEANIEKDPIMKTIRDNIRDKKPRAKEIITRLGQYYAQHYNDFAVRENCLWMDGRLAIPKDLSLAILNRLHYNHHELDKILAAAKDVWIPLMHRNFAATAKYCKSCLEADKAGNLPEVELTLDWEKRSDLVYAPQNRKAPIILDDDVVADSRAPEVVEPKEISPPKTPTWLKKHKTSSTTVYQRTGKTDPKDPRRSAAEESLIESKSVECTPGPSRNVHSSPAPSEFNKYKRKAETDRVAMENARRSTKQRIVEYSADESEDDEDSEWEIEQNEPIKSAANEGNDVRSVRENSPRSVGGKRNKNQCETATRNSTRQRRGVDKTGGGGVMINRIEHK